MTKSLWKEFITNADKFRKKKGLIKFIGLIILSVFLSIILNLVLFGGTTIYSKILMVIFCPILYFGVLHYLLGKWT